MIPKIKLEITKTKFEDNRNYKVSSDKAKIKLKFKPTIILEKGVEELEKIIKEKRIKNPFDNRYSNYLYLKNLENHKYKG